MIQIEKSREALTRILESQNDSVFGEKDPRLTRRPRLQFRAYPKHIDSSTWQVYHSPKHLDVVVKCVLLNLKNSGEYVVPVLDKKCNLLNLYECSSCVFGDIIQKLESEAHLWDLILCNMSPKMVMFMMGVFFSKYVHLHNNPL